MAAAEQAPVLARTGGAQAAADGVTRAETGAGRAHPAAQSAARLDGGRPPGPGARHPGILEPKS